MALAKLSKVTGVCFIRESGLEPFDVLRHRLQRGDQLVGRIGHFDAGLDWPFCLRLQVFRTSIPELGDVEDGIQRGGRVARAPLPAMADRGLEVVVTAGRQVVAGIARKYRCRHARIEPQGLAQRDLLGRDPLSWTAWMVDGRGLNSSSAASLRLSGPARPRRRQSPKGRRWRPTTRAFSSEPRS